MTVGELRIILSGLPDDMPVAYQDESWWRAANSAEVAPMKCISAQDNEEWGDFKECNAGETGTPILRISYFPW